MSIDMGTYQLGRHAILRLLIATCVALIFMLTLQGSPAAVARPTSCSIKNMDSGRTYTRLQVAVDAAKRGDNLNVRGTCRGRTVVDKTLAIKGVSTKRWGKPILDGGGKHRVLTIKAGREGVPRTWPRLSVRNLTIQNGHARAGGGVYNRSHLRLRDVVVRRNRSDAGGGGIVNWNELRLNGRSRVVGNEAGVWGGGVYNEVGLVVMTDASTIRRNSAARAAGVLNQDGLLILKDASSIRDNHANGGGAQGIAGGVHHMHESEVRGEGERNAVGMTCGPGGNVYDNTPTDCSDDHE